MLAPLYMKYESKSGQRYVYDRGSNEILRVGRVVYEILDDYRVLKPGEIVEKHRELGEARVRDALAELDALQARGILRDHAPQVQSRADEIVCEGEEESLEGILRNRRRSLTLELTQQCNLRCDYCCYGGLYANKRVHNDSRMSLETARNAVDRFLEPNPESCRIGFYGGEPLLEFDLLREVVAYAKEVAAKKGIKVEFSISTNGTLMTDEKIHFLVAHEFAVSISLDGPKESHDRYRIYRNDRHPERRVGSFDIVMRNLMRFGELYPDYSRRSILMTLTSTVDWNSANDLLKTLKPYYTVSPSIVDKTESSAPAAGAGTGTKEAASSQCGGACGKQELYTLGDFSEKKNVVVYGSENGSGAAPEFDDWTEPRKACFEESRERFLEGLADAAEPEELNENFPLFYAHFRQTQRRLHLRQLRDHAPSGCFNCGCFPGVTRTFYNVHGELYPCEKTQNGRLFQLGDCTSGVQVERPKRLMEFIRLLGDCGNCIAKELCTKCPASIKELDGTGRPDALDYQKSCGRMVREANRLLEQYTYVMENNSALVGKMLKNGPKQDWADEVEIRLTEEQRLKTAAELGTEQCVATS